MKDHPRVRRQLEGIPEFGIDRVAETAGSDPEVFRLEAITATGRSCENRRS